MKLAKMLAIDVPEVFIHFVGETPCYIIERYDRFRDNSGISQVNLS